MSEVTEDTKMARGAILDEMEIKDLNRKDYLNKKWFQSNKTSTKSTQDKKIKKKKFIKKNTYNVQSGLDDIQDMIYNFYDSAKLAGKLATTSSDGVVKEVEGLILLFTNLTQQTTVLGVISSALLYVRARLSTSLYKQVEIYLKSILMSCQSDKNPLWLDCLRLIKTNWNLVKSNKAFTQISKLLGLLVTIGLCDISRVSFNIGKFNIFEPDMNALHMTASDMVDAIFETIIYFAEGIYLCFKTGSLSPLLVNDRSCVENDEEYARLTTWWNLVKNGNLEKLEGVSDSEFQCRLIVLTRNFKNLSATLKGFDKKIVYDRYLKLLTIEQEFVTLKISNGIRHAPFALQFFGESNQGKTTCADQLINCLLLSQGLPVDDTIKCTYNASDKFMSNWTSDKLVLKFDDVANEKASFVERPPTRAIIDVINNEMYQAPKAELDAKGKVFVEPWIVTATTNHRTLDAYEYSNCPYSVQRRLIRVTVKVDPKFAKTIYCPDAKAYKQLGIDTAKVMEYYTVDGVYSPPIFDDIWLLTVEIAMQPDQLDSIAPYMPITYTDVLGQERKMVDVRMPLFVEWAIEAFAKHRTQQMNLVSSKNARKIDVELCGVDGCRQIKCMCRKHLKCQMGIELINDIAYDTYNSVSNLMDYHHLTSYIPSVNLIPYIKPLVLTWNMRNCVQRYWNATKVIWFTILLIVLIFPNIFMLVLSILLGINVQCNLYKVIGDSIVQEFIGNFNICQNVRRRYMDRSLNMFTKLSASCLVLYTLSKFWRFWSSQRVQGSLEPTSQEEIDNRDKEDNVWASVVKRDLPISQCSKTMTTTELLHVVDKNLVYGTLHLEGGNARMNGLFIKSNIILVPDHYFEQYGEELNCTFRKKNPETSGGKFTGSISRDASYWIPGSDMRLCYIANGGSFKDLTRCFPLKRMPEVPFIMHWRDKTGNIIDFKGVSKPANVTTIRNFNGGIYKKLTSNTFGGLCGATLVSDTIGSCILGIHLGGNDGTPDGCHGIVLQHHILDAVNSLHLKEGVIVCGTDHQFPDNIFGVQIASASKLHMKSPLNYMPRDSQISYHGSCVGRSSSHSDFCVSLISPLVLDICGMPNIYNPPKFKPEWFGWQDCLSAMSLTGKPFPYRLLKEAVIDYKRALIPIVCNRLWNDTSPLSDKENISGIAGKKFMDAIKLNTSIGYPLTGVKRKFVTETVENNEVLREFDDFIMDEIHRCEDLYSQGLRAYPIAKACKKDEVLSGEKCRIFYGNSIVLTFLIRKYYLPLVRILQMNPLKSECAVGINSHGPEWDEFYKFAVKHGEDRIIGGDYKNYDQRTPSQTIFAALRILIDLAKECKYSQRDLTIMEAMTADIVYAYIAFNGDLISLTEGGHISGNSLTVIINGICGSLNLRMCFFEKYPGKNFRDYVSLMTYGDDNIGSVSADIDGFTISGISAFLARYGQIYTMPDKNSEMTDFLPISQFEFLKRSSEYHPKLGKYVGALKDKSIFKSLHCYLRPRGTEITHEYACAINIDGALREWFNHGESLYEHRRQQMCEIASKAGISHMCNELDITYMDRVKIWHEKYNPNYVLYEQSQE